MSEILSVAAAIIASIGGSALIVAAFSNWLAKLWASRMLQNERALHAEKLESKKNELDLLKQKDVTRHYEKLAIYKDVVHLVCEILRDLEAVTIGKQPALSEEVEHSFSLNRTKAYGYIALVSSQNVLDKYNYLIDYFIPIVYEGQAGSWIEMREKADEMLNAMRLDLGINEEEVMYRGSR